MEINIRNFHPIGKPAGSYHVDELIEAVTLKPISISELIGRYNLLLEYVAANATAPRTEPAQSVTAEERMQDE